MSYKTLRKLLLRTIGLSMFWPMAVAVSQMQSSESPAAVNTAQSSSTPANTEPQSSSHRLEENQLSSEKAGWLRNLFTSSREKRQQWRDSGDFQSLARDTGDVAWTAAGQYREGDLPAAIDSFSALSGEAALYNRATALAHAGDYQQSLDEYDRLLQRNPQHEDALFNREIVEKLKQQQEQQQQEQQGDGQQSQDQQQEQQENQSSEASDNEQPSPEGQQQQTEQSGDESQSDSGEEGQPAQPDLNQLEQAQNQQQAQEQQEQLEQQRQQALRELAEQEPLNEQQQATEQWLRQIPDDPSGLLRRKLERSHVNDYPGVTNSKQPW